MKFSIYLKDPDGVANCIQEHVGEFEDDLVSRNTPGIDMSPEEIDSTVDAFERGMYDSIKKWVEFAEYVTIEIDTDLGTATVLEVAK